MNALDLTCQFQIITAAAVSFGHDSAVQAEQLTCVLGAAGSSPPCHLAVSPSVQGTPCSACTNTQLQASAVAVATMQCRRWSSAGNWAMQLIAAGSSKHLKITDEKTVACSNPNAGTIPAVSSAVDSFALSRSVCVCMHTYTTPAKCSKQQPGMLAVASLRT